MTDAHCHVTGGDPSVREFLVGRDFIGVHPWDCSESLESLGGLGGLESWLRGKLANPNLPNSEAPNFPNLLFGVGEIGLDRLRDRNIPPRMREVFEAQLKLALEFHRPVVLHGAKCWGQVVKTVSSFEHSNGSDIRAFPPLLFHGFSRSDGLIPDIIALNGYISVGPAILNDHAVNYRELVKKIPSDRLLLETDRTAENAAECPSVRDVAAAVATYRDMSFAELERITDDNAERFLNLI